MFPEPIFLSNDRIRARGIDKLRYVLYRRHRWRFIDITHCRMTLSYICVRHLILYSDDENNYFMKRALHVKSGEGITMIPNLFIIDVVLWFEVTREQKLVGRYLFQIVSYKKNSLRHWNCSTRVLYEADCYSLEDIILGYFWYWG